MKKFFSFVLFFCVLISCATRMPTAYATEADEKIEQLRTFLSQGDFAYHFLYGDEKRISLVLAFDGLDEELSNPLNQAQGANYIPWVGIKSSMIDLRESIKNHMDPTGEIGTDVMVAIVNANDHEEYFLIIWLDMIVLDIMENQ